MRRLLAVFITLGFLFPCPLWAGKDVTSTLENNVAEQQRRIKQVQKAMDEKRDLLRESRTREVNLMGQLEELDHALGSGRDRLTKLNREAADLKAQIQRQSEELTALASSKENAREHIKKRLAAFYRMGEIGLLNVAFSSANLSDLLNFKESFRILIEHDQQTLGGYHQQITTLTKLRDSLQKENAKLLLLINDSEQQTQHLADNRSNRLKLLNSISMEKGLYQQALEEMEGAAVNLNQTLAVLREKLAASQKAQPQAQSPGSSPSSQAGSDFAAMKGRLPPPVRGTVTTYFGKNTPGKFGVTTSADGIDIKTVAGSEINAIYRGKVVYIGQMRGYGNLLIIDHGHQYFSLMARATEFYKKVGETVATGEAIGVMGEQGGLLGEGLHFEIRHGIDPENPLEWINRSLLKTAPSAPGSASGRKAYKNN